LISKVYNSHKRNTKMRNAGETKLAVMGYVVLFAAWYSICLRLFPSQLLESAAPLEVYITGSSKPFYIPEAVLADVSPELAADAIESHLVINEGAFRIFTTWLLYRDLDDTHVLDSPTGQSSLAEAWNMGAHYQIPAFQNTVMSMLVFEFHGAAVDIGAVKQAYRTPERNTKLQDACVAHIARDNHDSQLKWKRANFTESGMANVPGFCLDLAIRLGAELADRDNNNHAQAQNFMVHEPSPLDDILDDDDDESVTEG
jgi:hypothetical protein